MITNIGLDHTGFLGDTVEQIATEKCGIFKEGGSAVVYRSTPGVEAVFEAMATEKNVTLKKADFDSLVSVSHSLEGRYSIAAAVKIWSCLCWASTSCTMPPWCCPLRTP